MYDCRACQIALARRPDSLQSYGEMTDSSEPVVHGPVRQAARLLLDGSAGEALLRRTLAILAEAIDADAYATWRQVEGTQDWKVIAHHGLSDGYVREVLAASPVPKSLAEGPVSIADVEKADFLSMRVPHYRQEGIRALLIIPLHLHGALGGTLVCYFKRARTLTADDLATAATLGDLISVAITTTELQERQNTLLRELRRSEQRYRTLALAGQAAQTVEVIDPGGKVIEHNGVWIELTGQTAEEMEERGWLDVVHPDDVDRVRNEWLRACDSGKVFESEFRLRLKDGSYKWVSSKAVPLFGEDDVIDEWIGTTVDIDQRRSTEEHLRFMARANEELSSSLDYRAVLSRLARLAVPALADWCAVDMVDETKPGELQRLAVAHVDPAKIELAYELRRRYPPQGETDTVRRSIATGISEMMTEIPEALVRERSVNADHARLILDLGLVSFMVVPLRSRAETFGAITFASSESGRRFTQTDLRHAEEFAHRAAVAIDNARLYAASQAASRAKDDFLATLSHELRTPMTAVLGWARLLADNLDADTHRTAVDAIQRGALLQAELIDDALDVSRIISGKMKLQPKPVALGQLTDAACETIGPAAEAKNVALTCEPGDPTLLVLGDPNRLQQVIWNVVSNAIKFTPAGGRVDIRVFADGAHAVVEVADSGKGIEPQFLPHVFEPFRQEENVTTRVHGGLGLGLAIVKYLTELHGGQVQVDSRGAGTGTTVRLEFPRYEDAGSAPAEPVREPIAGVFPSLDGLSILYVDDNADARTLVRTILHRAGASVTLAASAAEGRQSLDEGAVDLLISDVAMPGEDGISLIRSIRAGAAKTASLPALALTAFARPEDRANLIAAGFDDYVRKPLEPLELVEKVRALAAIRR